MNDTTFSPSGSSRLPTKASSDFDDLEPCLFNLCGAPSRFDRVGGEEKVSN